MITCNKEVDKHRENSSVYDNKAEEKTLIMSRKKEKACYGYVRMYGCGKQLLHSTNERACTPK